MALSKRALQKKAAQIRLIAMDVDGVLTSGDIILLQSGEEIKFWNSKDRLIIALVNKREVPLKFAWITGRASEAVRAGAENLGITHLAQGTHTKIHPFKEFLKKEGLDFSQAAFIGDDLIDLPPMKAAGLSVCPADAVSTVKEAADYISPYNGGRGVVRDVVEMVLKARKEWEPLVQSFYS